jgi:hypothetical protein
MSIVTVFEKIKLGLRQVIARTPEEQPEHLLGANHLSDALNAPAIIWVPLGAQKIDLVGGGHRSATAVRLSATEARQRIGEPNQFASRAELFEIHIWGKDFAQTEKLLNHLAATMRVQITAGFHPLATDWTLGQSQDTKGVTICLFKCSIGIPFTFEPGAVADYPLTLTLEGDIVTSEELEETVDEAQG